LEIPCCFASLPNPASFEAVLLLVGLDFLTPSVRTGVAIQASDKAISKHFLRPWLKKGEDVPVEIAEVEFLRAAKGDVERHDDLYFIVQSFIQVAVGSQNRRAPARAVW
jgi:hypothetical protein